MRNRRLPTLLLVAAGLAACGPGLPVEGPAPTVEPPGGARQALFGPPRVTPVGEALSGVTSGDVDGDGLTDVVLLDQRGQVIVVAGRDDGGAAEAHGVFAGDAPAAAAVADLDGDRRADLAVALRGFDGVRVFLGGPEGLHGRELYETGLHAAAVAVGDLDGDGRLDLAVANGGSDGAALLAGRGDGSFAAPVRWDVRARPSTLLLYDYDGDGRLDLLAGGEAPGLTFRRGLGDGRLDELRVLPLAERPTALKAADLDGDGRDELLILDGSRLLVVRDRRVTTSEVGRPLVGLALGDADGDGRADLAAVDESGALLLFPGAAGDRFAAPLAVAAPPAVRAVHLADLDGDGRSELCAATATHLFVYAASR
jgi:hypothetical protein